MIERKFVAERVKEHQILEFVSATLKNVGHSHTKMVRTPLGEKIIIFASRPGLVVGRKGENIKKLTSALKKKFELENPQIEISEIENPNIDAQIIAERIASTLERFGSQKFKAIAHKSMQDAMSAGALGIEIKMAGKIPSARAKTWRFFNGYMKKSGQIAITGVKKAYAYAQLKTGTIGIQVRIMPPDLKLPDDVEVKPTSLEQVATPATMAAAEGKPVEAEHKPEEKPKRKRAPKKKEETEVKTNESEGTQGTQ
ncbi:MAG TPA: 30S ribosomal protein S3 [Candidatus Binatia bacterium]|nr:30S ribosomal protein S3 [Candidatus Binatia bacterium]